MTSRPAATRRGAHRSRRNLVGAVVPSLLAVLAVVALVTSLYVWRAEDPGAGNAGTGTDTAEPITAASSAAAEDTPSPSPSPTTTRPAGASTSAAPSPTRSRDRARDLVGTVEVVVLNQTDRAGLAARVAQVLRDKGWTVPATGNFRGVVPATTVYYPPGAEDEALAAARGLPTEPRVRPRFGNLSTSRLTVVVTDSYPS